MNAYKFLADGRTGPFSGFAWPPPGEWVEADGPVDVCRRGVHACEVGDLPEWLSDELWRIELEGEIARTGEILVAERGRLVSRVDGWDEAAASDFARACAERLRERAKRDGRFASYAEDAANTIEAAADPRRTALVSFMARHAAAEVEPGGWQAERKWQSRLLADRLGL